MPEALEPADELIAERRAGGPGQLPSDMPPAMARTITIIDTVNYWVGWAAALFTVPIFLIMVYEIVMRKFFLAPTMWAYDVSRMLYGAMFMLGSGYALMRGVHIRADFIYRNLSVKRQGLIDFALYLIFYFPGMVIFLWVSIDYALASIVQGERGMDTAWMPHLGPIKGALPLGVFFLALQGISELLKSYYAMTRGRWPQ